ncbi:hypothetical protein [Arsenophonus sp.]|nr:hypothetical protein [Arsenophonus sp.]MDR5617846.1 hypothetical protein [Arsenophonus sp.]
MLNEEEFERFFQFLNTGHNLALTSPPVGIGEALQRININKKLGN